MEMYTYSKGNVVVNNGKATFDLNSYNEYSADFLNVLNLICVSMKYKSPSIPYNTLLGTASKILYVHYGIHLYSPFQNQVLPYIQLFHLL